MDAAGQAAIAGLGGAAALLLRTLARYVRQRMLARRVRDEAADGPEFGTVGWIWRELVRERGARHALRDRLDAEIADLRERLARIEGRQESADGGIEPAPSRGKMRSRPG